MQEAPFDASRSGSEEDILEYEEPLITCDVCRRKRKCTLGEKILLVVAAVCVIIIIALSVAISNSNKEPKVSSHCDSSECLQAASSLAAAMDPTANPCEDFHQYACGGWLRETPIPPGYPVWDRFQELSYKNMYILKNLIETHTLYGSAQSKAQVFYQSCMDESKVTRTETLSDLRSLVGNITSRTNGFNFLDILTGVHSVSTWPLFRLIVGPDERNNDRNIIKIEAGDSPFPYNVFRVENKSVQTRSTTGQGPETTTATSNSTENLNITSDGISVTVNGTNNDSTGYSTLNSEEINTNRRPVAEFPKENVTELINNYLRETSNIIVAVWKKSRADADIEARQIFELERRISLAHDIAVHIHNRTQAYNAVTISDLEKDCKSIDWMNYFSRIFSSAAPLSKNTEVIVLHKNALIKTCSIITEYTSNTTLQSILQRYLKLSVVRSLKPYFDLSTFQEDIRPDKEFELEGEPWRRCTFYTNKALGFATGAIYVNGTASHSSFAKVKNLIEYVKKAFKNYLLHKIWIDDKTKHNAEVKIDEMIEKVSYPTYILNTTFVDDYYKKFVVGDDWFRNLINWRSFAIQKMVFTLTEKYDRIKSWINPPVTVDSDYSPIRNDIIFPIAMLHLPIYNPDGPGAMNFGALGSLIGHEITHAFDVQGRQYDGFGRLRDWFDPMTASMFNTTTRCMKTQYSDYSVCGMAIDGERTLEENIADNGGVRAALVAYELWLQEHGNESPIPGLHYTHRQIFYISFAQLFCSKWKDDGIKQFLLRDAHSPGPFRIQGALSNSLTFQEVFDCPYTAKYNPSIKCQVW